MSIAALIFPHQLYPNHPAIEKDCQVFLIEEFLYFHQYPFHKAKLVFHRASMGAYKADLIEQGYPVAYIEAKQEQADVRKLIPYLKKRGIAEIRLCDPTDEWLLRRVKTASLRCGLKLSLLPSPNFLCAADEIVAGRKQPMYFQTDFYVRQRKKQGWLMDKSGKPVGGQWSFDADNRKPLPKGLVVPVPPTTVNSDFVDEALQYVEKQFPRNYGAATQPMFPIDRKNSLRWLDSFLETRLASFGSYEDAMHPEEILLFHSGLTPMLNIGLISPAEVIERMLKISEQKKIPLASTEGFLRQVTGWREFIRLVYVQAGNQQRTTNFWKFNRKIPESFWRGETGIVPVDQTIRKLLRTGYSHHIERLMILGNFMLLCEFDPDEVYKWFMTLYIDAYDWVMVPNVYGMTQFADGGLMTTKPYISGSNYLMKMGKWEKGEWQAVWDGLFWRFMSNHRSFFTQNPRLGMLIRSWDKMDPAKKQAHLHRAEQYLKKMDG